MMIKNDKQVKFNIKDEVYAIIPSISKGKKFEIVKGKVFDSYIGLDNSDCFFCMFNRNGKNEHAFLDEKYVFGNEKEAISYLRNNLKEISF